jgi:hypothetical protein
MNRSIPSILIFLVMISAIAVIVQADEINPPASIKICGYVSHNFEIGIWWANPSESDFAGVQVWFDNVYIGQTDKTTHFYTTHSEVIGYHTLSTHTVDTFNNVNPAWSNRTVELAAYPACREGWYCTDAEYCTMPTGTTTPTPTPTETVTVTVTPTSWVNQTYNATSDICQIRADAGETWVKWDVTCNTTVEVLYYIDGKKLENTTPFQQLDPNRLILSDLKPMESHNLKIYYLDNLIAESEVTTLTSWYMILFFVVLSLILSLMGLLFISSPVYRILISGLSLSIAVWTMTLMTGVMLAVPIIPAIFAGITIIFALKDLVTESWGN